MSVTAEWFNQNKNIVLEVGEKIYKSSYPAGLMKE